MKQFPYAQTIIWENDVEQIEWEEDCDWYWKSCLYVVQTKQGERILGVFRNTSENNLEFVSTGGWDVEISKLSCWAKL